MSKTVFVKNAAVLTVSSIILRFVGIIFKVWLAGRIGSEGVGLYQLVFSLFVLAGAFTQSGLPTAVTRLVAGETALGSRDGVGKIMSLTFRINLILSAVTAVVLFFGAELLGTLIIADSRAALSIRIISVSVFFMGVSSVIRGYFIARRKAAPGAFSQLLEQVIRIAVILFAIRFVKGGNLAAACAAVFLGDTLAEVFSCIYLVLRYRFDIKHLKCGDTRHERQPLKKIIEISFPLTAGRYLNSLLRTAENMLVPRALYKYSKKGALSLFGMIKGMALPILFFPSVILNAVSTLLIPEMSEAAEKHRTSLVRSAVEEIIYYAAIVGFIFSAVFAAAGYQIGLLLYKSADVGFLLTALSPIVPLMYVDSLCDGLLKGLNQQNFTFRVSVCDSAIRLIFVYPVLIRFGIGGFIGIMYFSNLLTCFLNVNRLIKISGATLDTKKTVLIPVSTAFTATLVIKAVLSFFAFPNLVYIILLTVTSVSVYFVILAHFDCINLSTFGRIRTHKKYAPAKIRASLIK